MKRKQLYRRVMTLLLTAVLLAGMLPAALAADACPACGSAACEWTAVSEANCHKAGVKKAVCSACQKTTYVESPVDPANHDAICTDTGDGKNHTATCPYHADYTAAKEAHTFVSGRCAKCLALDHSQVKITLPAVEENRVALGDSEAVLTLKGVKMSIGEMDVTAEYALSYSWYYQGSPVGAGESYRIPTTVTAREGEHNYVCFVMAVPNSSIGGKPISASCTVTVSVRDQITARAAITTRDTYFGLIQTNGHTPVSVVDQIRRAVLARSGSDLSHVVFDGKPVSAVGDLKLTSQTCYLTPAAGQAGLSTVHFEATGTAGAYTIPYTAYDSKGTAYPGTLTVTADYAPADAQMRLSTVKNVPVALSAADFETFWKQTYSRGTLTLARFTALPDGQTGALRSGYVSASRPGTAVTEADSYYAAYTAGVSQTLISDVKFVPADGFTGTVVIPFEAYGQNDTGVQTYLSGKLMVLVTAAGVADISYKAVAGGSAAFAARDFLSVCQTATGKQTSSFYIQLLSLPISGSLSVKQGGQSVKLTAASAAQRSFYYSSAEFSQISDLTYTPGTAATETAEYACYDARGVLQYVGRIVFTRSAGYTRSFTDVPKTAATEWYYTAVMDLAEAGIINGMTDTTYEPDTEVTYGQALKLILMASGYDYQQPTGTHWASGFLSVAHAKGFLPTSVTESYLDRKISRNIIAQIATKALELPASALTASPFSDVEMDSAYAAYILPLYDAKIVVGSPQADGTYKYYGVNSIRRSEMAVIIWRMNNYSKS